MSDTPLHREDPTGRFSDRASAYARYRPDYPAAALEAVLDAAGVPPSEIVVADLGAGTGISSRLIAERGALVHAVEPNAAMRERIAAHPRIRPVAAPAEALPFESGSIDLVTAFQAFHWFDPEPALAEARRVLRTGGALALVWNERDDERDAFTAEYRILVREASNDHSAESRMEHVGPLYASPHFTNVRKLAFPHEQRLDWDGVIGRLRSTSYLPQEGAAWERLLARMRELHARYADARGIVALVYETKVYVAERL